ncbi:MAG: phosphate/phosphite/phosphonate ABC transporter substrate-binding protein [Nitrospirota bacterium]
MTSLSNNKIRTAITILAVFIICLAGLATCSYAAETYTFGVVPQYDQRQLFDIWKPLIDELQRRTGLSFRLVSVPNIPVFQKDFLNGKYDFVYTNPYDLLQAQKSQGYAPIVRDRAPLRGILVVRKDSPIKKLAELNNKVVAFPAPNALGASLLMRADLFRIYHVNISPLYVKTHDSVYLHVVKGLADAGGGVQKTLEEQEKPIQEALKVLYTTRDLPSHPIAAHPRVPVRDAEKVRKAFLEMAAAEEGRKLLLKIPMKQPVSTSMDDYSPMRDWGLESFWVEE